MAGRIPDYLDLRCQSRADMFAMCRKINIAIFWLLNMTYVLIKTKHLLHNLVKMSYDLGWKIWKYTSFLTNNMCHLIL